MAELEMILGLVQDIKVQLDDVEDKCDQLVEFRAVHTEAHKIIEGRQVEFKRTLYGSDNGGGLTYKVDRLLKSAKDADKWSGFWIGMLKTLVTAAIIAVTVWLLSVYKTAGS